jgi:hypothetical protein
VNGRRTSLFPAFLVVRRMVKKMATNFITRYQDSGFLVCMISIDRRLGCSHRQQQRGQRHHRMLCKLLWGRGFRLGPSSILYRFRSFQQWPIVMFHRYSLCKSRVVHRYIERLLGWHSGFQLSRIQVVGFERQKRCDLEHRGQRRKLEFE